MRTIGTLVAAAAAATLLAGVPAAAQEAAGAAPQAGFVSEIRVSVATHDANFVDFNEFEIDPFGHDVETGLDLGASILFTSPEALAFLGAPRPHLGIGISTAGQTNHAYGGLTWGYTFESGLFAEGFLGLAIHDGYNSNAPEGRLALGSPILFHFGGDLGWRFDGGLGVALFWEHMSSGSILGPATSNPAMDNLGIRLSYRFD